jgi:hypothetical protein
MALWQITSHRIAVDAELQLRRTVTLLRCCAPASPWRSVRADPP